MNDAFEKYWQHCDAAKEMNDMEKVPRRLEIRARRLIAWRAWHAAEIALRNELGMKWIRNQWVLPDVEKWLKKAHIAVDDLMKALKNELQRELSLPPNVPKNVFKAARKVSDWIAENDIHDWMIDGLTAVQRGPTE